MALARRVGRMRETFPVLIGTLVSQTAINIVALVLLGDHRLDHRPLPVEHREALPGLDRAVADPDRGTARSVALAGERRGPDRARGQSGSRGIQQARRGLIVSRIRAGAPSPASPSSPPGAAAARLLGAVRRARARSPGRDRRRPPACSRSTSRRSSRRPLPTSGSSSSRSSACSRRVSASPPRMPSPTA